jgi:carboxylate-amine ligase
VPPKIGVEEELLLVDPETGQVTGVAQRALLSLPDDDELRPDLEAELYQQQIELASEPCLDLDSLHSSLCRARHAALGAARTAGAVAVAVPTPVLEAPTPRVSPTPRYHRIYDDYGMLARHSLVCGMHVHVDVADPDEAVAVVDGVRPWLPVLLAVSANSPYWQGQDTGHASWRSQLWNRWPTGGPREPLGSAAEYRRTASLMQEWGAALDDGMLYYDVRPAAELPTVELRVADVCTELDDTVLVAALARALVATVAAEHRAGRLTDISFWRADLLRAAQWRAARWGMGGPLVHPERHELKPAREVVHALVDRTADALDESGDRERVLQLVEQLLARGHGAARQRAVRESHGELTAVVADLAARTEPSAR